VLEIALPKDIDFLATPSRIWALYLPAASKLFHSMRKLLYIIIILDGLVIWLAELSITLQCHLGPHISALLPPTISINRA
jgi:hypothetical protein